MFDKMLLNPAYAGSSRWIVGSLKNRMQFVNLDGAPTTNVFTFQAPVQVKRIGLGAKIIQDKIAVTNSLIATGFFSYHIGFGKGKLSFGIEGGIVNNSFNYGGLDKFDAVDPAIDVSAESALLPEISTGLFYQTSSFYLGASVYHLFNSDNKTSALGNSDLYSLKRSFYGIGGYTFELSKKIFLEPGFLLKYAGGSTLQADLNLTLFLFDRLSLGTSYRTGDAVVTLLKVDITRNLKILYSYDIRVSNLANYSKGSHEIGISYGIELLPPPEQKVIHPRFYF
jgi:type IX secretion system PorP/SprF family membrane protein